MKFWFVYKWLKISQKKFWYIPHPQVDMNSTVKSAKFMRENKNFFLEEDKNLDIDAIIKEKSDWNHMFIFWVYSNILYNFESEENIWHIIASPWYESWQDKITLLETFPNAEKIFIEYENIVPAMLAWWGLEEITIISLTA